MLLNRKSFSAAAPPNCTNTSSTPHINATPFRFRMTCCITITSEHVSVRLATWKWNSNIYWIGLAAVYFLDLFTWSILKGAERICRLRWVVRFNGVSKWRVLDFRETYLLHCTVRFFMHFILQTMYALWNAKYSGKKFFPSNCTHTVPSWKSSPIIANKRFLMHLTSKRFLFHLTIFVNICEKQPNQRVNILHTKYPHPHS